jgi:RNA polymerase sigma factor (sigma-70 family)
MMTAMILDPNDEGRVVGDPGEQDRQISEVISEEQSRLRRFIRRRVPDQADAEDLLQDVFSELVQAKRLLQPIDYITGWLFRVARNRITDFFRKKRPETFSDAAVENAEGELLEMEDLLPSPDAGPEAVYIRGALLEELQAALDELPAEQREVFLAHEVEGRSFKELSAETGVSVNTLLSRKRYAVLYLRGRLQSIHDAFITLSHGSESRPFDRLRAGSGAPRVFMRK